MSAIVTRNLCIPFGAKTGESTTVRCNYNVAVRSHESQIPTVRPELANWRLWAALTIQYSRILFVRVEFRRINNPCGHKFTIGGRHKALFGFDWVKLTQYFIVHTGEFNGLFARLNRIYFIWLTYAMTQSVHLVEGWNNGCIVAFAGGYGVDLLSIHIHFEHWNGALIWCKEENRLVVDAPCQALYTIVPISSQIGFCICGDIKNEDSFFVAFITVVFHG